MLPGDEYSVICSFALTADPTSGDFDLSTSTSLSKLPGSLIKTRLMASLLAEEAKLPPDESGGLPTTNGLKKN